MIGEFSAWGVDFSSPFGLSESAAAPTLQGMTRAKARPQHNAPEVKRPPPFSMRLSPGLRERIERRADAENRSLANMVETLVIRALDAEEGR